MVIARGDVVHVGRNFRAPGTGLAPVRAAVVVAPQDALPNDAPVGREALTPIRTVPLRHSAHHRSRRGKGLAGFRLRSSLQRDSVCGRPAKGEAPTAFARRGGLAQTRGQNEVCSNTANQRSESASVFCHWPALAGRMPCADIGY